MALEITGKVIKLLGVQKGESSRGPWQKGGFVIETEGTYPKKVCCVVWGDNLNQVNSLKEGDPVKASIEIESREYNDRWYTDVKAWKIESLSGGSGTSYAPPAQPKEDVGYQDVRADASSSGEGADDLPF